MAEPISDERLAEIRAGWAEGGALNRTGQEVRGLLAEVDRLRAALARVTDDSMAEGIVLAIRRRLSWASMHWDLHDRDMHRNVAAAVLDDLRAVAAGGHPNDLPTQEVAAGEQTEGDGQ